MLKALTLVQGNFCRCGPAAVGWWGSLRHAGLELCRVYFKYTHVQFQHPVTSVAS